ncbi:MAG: TonB-dependent receptor [Acidobacteria bacterium]|nr:TonB-dependent receptor [Acidobacteriota bacterium]
MMQVLIAAALFAITACCATGAEVHGLVLDPSGAAAANTEIRFAMQGQASAGATTTGPDGKFHFMLPARGVYVLTATKTGFASLQQRIDVGDQPLAITLRLELDVRETRLTVTADNQILDANLSPQPVTVIPRKNLETRVVLLSEIAEAEPGVHQLRTSPTLGSVFARGLTGKNVAVFRDGVRYTSSAQRGGISTFLNLVQPESLDSVEVVRGPNSAQYGSDSLGGTVSLLSRFMESKPGSWHGGVSSLYQSVAHAFGPSATIGRSGTRFSLQSQLSLLRSSTLVTGQGIDSHAAVTRFLGLPSTVLGPRLPDTAFTAYGGSFHSQMRLRPTALLIGHYERSQQDGGKRYDQLLGGDGNWIADLRNLMLDFGYLRYQQFQAGPLDQVSVTGSYNAQREERVNQGGQGNPNAAITHQYEKTKVHGVQGVYEKRTRGMEWLGGGEAYFERIVAPSFAVDPVNNAVTQERPRIPDGATYSLYGVYQQLGWHPWQSKWLRLSGAIRYGGSAYESRASNSPLVGGKRLWPDDSLSASALTGRIGAATWFRDWAGLHLNYSRGFRAPNVTDLGTLGLQGNGQYEAAVADLAGRGALIGDRADDQARSTGLPVERLRPEFSDNIDAGIRFRRPRWQAELTGFWLNLGNSIISQALILPPGAVGQPLGEQTITRQLPGGAVFVPLSTSPVLVRSNYSGAKLRGIEHSARLRLSSAWTFSENLTFVEARDSVTGLPPDIEPGVPPFTFNPVLGWRPHARFWVEAYGTLAGRQDRLSSLALSDRRIGGPRSRADIQSFFNNGARTRGLVANGILLTTGESLARVQQRVLGSLDSAPQFTAIPGFVILGLRGGLRVGERTDLMADVSNFTDKNYRGIGWGLDGPGRSLQIRLRHRF